jgi:hypothetical protein
MDGLAKLLEYFDPDEPNNLADTLPYISHAKPAGAQ